MKTSESRESRNIKFTKDFVEKDQAKIYYWQMVKPSDKKRTKRVVFIGESHEPITLDSKESGKTSCVKCGKNSSQPASYVANDWLPN